MTRFRKVDPRIWTDEKFRMFTDSEKLAFLYILTHPNMTSVGAMRATIPGLAAELGWESETLSKALAKPLLKGMLKYDSCAFFLWLPHFLHYNAPENPNVLKAWRSALDSLPECPLKGELTQTLAEFVKGLSEPFQKAFESLLKGLTKPFRKPEPEPEPEKDAANAAPTVLSTESCALAEKLRLAIANRDPRSRAAKLTNTTLWAKEIDKLIRIDGRKAGEIERVIAWAQSDSFWAPNILSGRKLREKFDTLWGQMTRRPQSKPAADMRVGEGEQSMDDGQASRSRYAAEIKKKPPEKRNENERLFLAAYERGWSADD